MVLHGLQVWEQRGHTLVGDGGVGGVVGRETHPDGGEARNRLQQHLEVLVGGFTLPTPGQVLAGKRERGHMFGQVGQRRQRLRKRAQELADVIACRYAMLCCHGVHDQTRSEHVRRDFRKSGPKNVRVGCADACQKSSGEVAAGEGEIGMLGCRHAVNIDRSRSGVACMSSGLSVGGPIAMYRCLAGGDINGVGEVHRHEVPFLV